MMLSSRITCPVCGANKKRTIFSIKYGVEEISSYLKVYYNNRIDVSQFSEEFYEISNCLVCDFLWQKNVVSDNCLGELYSKWISASDSAAKKKRMSISMYQRYSREVESISKLLKIKYPCDIKVMDFGMGWGIWSSLAKSYGYDVCGYEVADDKIALAKSNNINVINNLDELADDSLDFINVEQVLEHINSPLELLGVLVSKMKKGGIIHVSVPNGRKIKKQLIKNGWNSKMNAVHPLEHINCFTNNTLCKLAFQKNLKKIKRPLSLAPISNVGSFLYAVLFFFRQFYSTSLYFQK